MISDTVIHTVAFAVERKQIEVSLRQNPQGRFLRITECVSNHRDAIIVPAAGLQLLSNALNEMLEKDAELD